MVKKKEKNTFKFQGFAERISNIRLDVSHRVERRTETPDETETFCNEALNKWRELNCTIHFQSAAKDLHPLIQTLAQLVHHEKQVVEILKSHLLVPDSLSLEPLLDILVQLARDLQCDFYPYFNDFFNVLVTLLSVNSQDSVVLEQVFSALGYLFKFLWRYQIKDMDNLFRLYSPLLSEQQKSYVQQFAAESFAFLTRKVKDHGKLLDTLFGSLESREDLVEGIGYLCFEMIKGVRKQFHSQTDRLLPAMLRRLGPGRDGDEEMPLQLPWSLVFYTLSHAFKLMAKFTSKEHGQVVEKCLVAEAKSLHKMVHTTQESTEQGAALAAQLSYVLQLTEVWVEWNDGDLVADPSALSSIVLSILKSQGLPEQVLSSCLQLLSSILLINFPELTKDRDQRQLIKTVFTSNFPMKEVFTFAKSLLNWKSFSDDILPSVLELCQGKLYQEDCPEFEEIVFFLVEIILKDESDDEGHPINVKSKAGLLYFPKAGTKSGQKILDKFLGVLEVKANTCLALAWATLICVPCFRPLNAEMMSGKVLDFIQQITSMHLHGNEDPANQSKWLYILAQAIQTYVVLDVKPGKSSKGLGFDYVCDLLRTFPSNIHILHACHCILMHAKTNGRQDLLKADKLQLLYPSLASNLSSSAHLVRLVTLRILVLFDQLELSPSEDNPSPGKCNLFQVCLDAESIPASFQRYRDKLIHLRKLTFSQAYHQSLPTFYHDVTTRYLVGQMYLNFNPTWEPVIEILKSHAHGSNVKIFWGIFSEHLQMAADKTEICLREPSTSSTTQTTTNDVGSDASLHSLFTSLYSVADGSREDNRTDHVNFRYLLWKAMAEFPGVVEIRSRDLVPLFLRFLSTEYAFSDDNAAPSQDIRKQNQAPDTTGSATNSDEPEDAVDREPISVDHKQHRKAATKSLCIHLNLFGLFHNPKALSKEPQVRQIYMAMLAHRDSAVQKLAVKCILTYRFPYMEPYREHLDKLLEDESFRDELALFTVDDGNAVVEPVHREGLMPVVIRLLYGKMQRWTGAGTQGKAGIGARRSVVLRFLGSCPVGEMSVFMDLILAPFKHLYTESSAIVKVHDLASIVPLKIQQGFLTMMGQILHKLGIAVSTFLPSLLQISLSLLYTCGYALQHRDEVHPPRVSLLKAIRQLAITRLIDFYELLPSYDYSTVCEHVYEAAVWPQIGNLRQECIQNPTPLLKLLHCWSKKPRYHPLLSKKLPNSSNLSIMNHVYSCLKAENVNQSVVTMVMEMTENLLSLDEYEANEEETDLLSFGSEVSVCALPESTSLPSYGASLVLPHIPALLEHLGETVKTLSKFARRKGMKKSKSSLPKLELSILSKISPFVKEAEDSVSFIKLLLPFLQMRQREDIEVNTIKTIKNLLSNVDTPASFLKPLGRLFSQLNSRSSRQCLCDVFREIARLDDSFSDVAKTVVQMNSWDPKRIEEPNYESRVAGFATASRMVLEGATRESETPGSPPKTKTPASPTPAVIPVDHILPLLHNCLYYIHRSDDLSIRDIAVSCLNAIIQRVSTRQDNEEFEELILNSVVPSCKLALRAKSESARLEFLGVLSTMVRQFDKPCFTDMRILTDIDPEADFFENMRHIQLHRRIRALRRLETHCQNKALSQPSLVGYLLPLATSYLHDYSAAKDHNLLTQAIATIGSISACLRWSKYSHLLRQHLKALQRQPEKQKTTVRIVVAILDAFHFDLRTFQVNIANEKPVAGKHKMAVKQLEESIEPEAPADGNVGKKSEKEEEEEEEADDDEDLGEEGNEQSQDDVLDDELALRIYETISKRILPQLLKSLIKKSQYVHRLSHSKADDQDSALRVPIALAVVKLLQALPQHTLHLHLPGLLMKVCLTLKSRARDVRDTARDTLCQIALSLGTKYFSFVLKEMKSSLLRGYQLHVLGFTLHSILVRMTSQLSPGNLDHCLPEITEVLVENLFGEVATEREVDKITGKLHEAKSSKSQDTFEILAKFVGSSSVMQLVAPLKQVLDTHQSHKVSRRVEETLRRIGIGLQANESITTQTLLVFIHGLTSEKLSVLDAQNTTEKKDPIPPPDPRLRATDTYTIQPEVIRGGKTPEVSTRTNAHVVVEFGLQLLQTALKRGKVSTADQTHLQMLDPFVSVMMDCLQAKHTKVLTLSLRCLCWIIKLPLPSLDKSVPQMAKLLFKLLKKFATAGAKVGDNFEMVLSGFKAMTVIIRDFKKYTIAEKHLQVLLSFVEEDIHDHSRQGTAFPLLKAILSRKLMVPEIHDVMKKVAQLSITGATPIVQQQCRQCMLQFMLDYPLGKKLQRNLEFFVSQLGYEHETGRESALEMMASIFSTFPEALLFEYAGFFFVPLTTRLVNDDSGNCRKLTALTIKTLLQKLDVERRDSLFSMVLQWFNGEKVALRRLAAQVCGLFVEVETKTFERRLPTVLSIIACVIEPANYDVDDPEEATTGPSIENKSKDHLLFNTITTLAKILKECQIVRVAKRNQDMVQIWESVEAHLCHPHMWVRLACCRLFGLLFSGWTPEELTQAAAQESSEYLADNVDEKIAKLCEDFCAQLESPYLDQELGDQVVKNLVFLAKFLHHRDPLQTEEGGSQRQRNALTNAKSESKGHLTLVTLLEKMERLATHEASQTPKKTQKRTCVLRWLAAVAMSLGKQDITPYLRQIVEPIHRELEVPTTYKDPALQSLAQEVLELIKGLVGREAFSEVYAALQHIVKETKEKRKRQRALEAVADPAESARRKVKRNLAKKETRKRKIDAFKPERLLKRKRTTQEMDN